MKIKPILQSQYLAALAMLKQAIVKCPQAMWNARQDRDKFWFIAYHAIYYAHLYLQPTRKEFVRWKKYGKPVSRALLSKVEVLEYLEFAEQEVARQVRAMDLKAGSGFQELHVDKLELQFVNIRHIQQHTGELYERLGARKNIKLSWAEQRQRKNK